MVSNLSYMKRVMMLVLPTDWSPRKTSLYLARGDTVAIFEILFFAFGSESQKKNENDLESVFFFFFPFFEFNPFI